MMSAKFEKKITAATSVFSLVRWLIRTNKQKNSWFFERKKRNFQKKIEIKWKKTCSTMAVSNTNKKKKKKIPRSFSWRTKMIWLIFLVATFVQTNKSCSQCALLPAKNRIFFFFFFERPSHFSPLLLFISRMGGVRDRFRKKASCASYLDATFLKAITNARNKPDHLFSPFCCCPFKSHYKTIVCV